MSKLTLSCVIILAGAYVLASFKWVELKTQIDNLEQRTAWMCRLPIAGPTNVGKLVITPPDNYNGKDQVKLEGCP